MAQSRRFNLSASLGRVARLPFTPRLAVLPGDVVALTTPTWAPVLHIGLSAKRFAYRQSRLGRCAHAPAGAFAPLAFGGSSALCVCYAGTTVELAAIEQLTSGAATPCRGPFTLPAVEGPAAIVFDAVRVTAAAGIGCSAALHVAAKAWAERGLRYVFGTQFAPGAYGGPFRAGRFRLLPHRAVLRDAGRGMLAARHRHPVRRPAHVLAAAASRVRTALARPVSIRCPRAYPADRIRPREEGACRSMWGTE